MHYKDLKLNKGLINALIEQGITEQTEIQEKSFSLISSGKSLVGIAQTGTGKSLAYLVPILKILPYSNQKNPRVLIIVPTRELVVQVTEQLEKLTKYLSIRTLGIYGGANINIQKQLIHDGIDILVSTPGRLYDISLTGILRLISVKHLVLDEFDEMLSLGFKTQLQNILDLLPPKRQNLLFSATNNDDVSALIKAHFQPIVEIQVSQANKALETIDYKFYSVPNFNTKLNFLKHLFEDNTYQKVLIFAKSKKFADLIFNHLNYYFENQFGVLHSNKSQNLRLRMLHEFEQNVIRGIVSTDVMSRGIDVQSISHVINFDLPEDTEQFIHRTGRTGRNKEKGITLSFVNHEDELKLESINNYLNHSYEIQQLPQEIEISDELIREEEPVNIHDAPTLNQKYKKVSSNSIRTKKSK